MQEVSQSFPALTRLQETVEKDHDLLVRLGVKMDDLPQRFDARMDELNGRFARFLEREDDREKRLRVLEASRWRVVGFAGGMSVVLPVVVSIVLKLMGA